MTREEHLAVVNGLYDEVDKLGDENAAALTEIQRLKDELAECRNEEPSPEPEPEPQPGTMPPLGALQWESKFTEPVSADWRQPTLSDGGGSGKVIGNRRAQFTGPPSGSTCRAEWQVNPDDYDQTGQERIYEFGFVIPANSSLRPGDYNHINQFKGKFSLYDGGFCLDKDGAKETLLWRVRGGAIDFNKPSSDAYEVDEYIPVLDIERDKLYTIRAYVKWSPTAGYVHCFVNGQERVPRRNMKTIGVGAGEIKYRNGLYRGSHSGTSILVIEHPKIYAAP